MQNPSASRANYAVKTLLFALLALLITANASFAADAAPWTVKTKNNLFEVTFGPEDGPVRINTMQNWVVTVKDTNDREIDSANILLDGGMKAHGHGLPTKPLVTKNLGEGRYLIEGIRLNMVGAWTLLIGVDIPGRRDVATFEFEIDY